MGEGAKHRFHGNPTIAHDEDSDELFESDGFSSDSEDDNSAEDANTSPTPSPPSNSCSGPLYELSSLMQQLPVNSCRKGLSKHYNGKSQSFTSLADVQCLEDLPKKENPIVRKMKPSKSYAVLDGSQKPNQGQGSKAMPKKPPRVSSCASFIATSKYS